MMQYILTEEEYQKLKSESQHAIKLSKKKLQSLCTKICNEMPVVWGWGGDDPKPWRCILTEPDDWYCDKCPVIEICPHPGKEYSK